MDLSVTEEVRRTFGFASGFASSPRSVNGRIVTTLADGTVLNFRIIHEGRPSFRMYLDSEEIPKHPDLMRLRTGSLQEFIDRQRESWPRTAKWVTPGELTPFVFATHDFRLIWHSGDQIVVSLCFLNEHATRQRLRQNVMRYSYRFPAPLAEMCWEAAP